MLIIDDDPVVREQLERLYAKAAWLMPGVLLFLSPEAGLSGGSTTVM